MNRALRTASFAALCAVALGAGPLLADAVVSFGSIPAGADEAGRVQLYAPDPATPGSSISHWDLATSPLLMWPAISGLLGFEQTDLTMPLFRDLGYSDGTASFDIQYMDAAGFGFNETDAAAPLPTNPGTTFGEQRRIVLEHVLAKWASMVGKTTPTTVLAVHNDRFCDATSAVLASAGPTCAYTFTDASSNPLFVAGNMLAEVLGDFNQDDCTYDVDGDGDQENGDIIVNVNKNIDYSPSCLGGAGYYYGLDDNIPSGQISFANVLLHEIGHGIGFASFTDRNPANSTFGEFYYDVPGVFDRLVLDNSTGKHFDAMTKNERRAAIENGPHVVWDGANVVAESATWAKLPSVEVVFPEGGGEFEAQAASFGAPVFGASAVLPTGLVTIANPERACTAIGDVTGKIVLIERNDCPFIQKFENAVAAGAVAVIVYNSANPSSGGPEDLVAMAGSSDNTTVPALFLRRSDGLDLRNLAINGPDLACVPSALNACLLGGRFQVSVAYTTSSSAGLGQVMSFNGARAESDQSAFFYFFDNANFEMGVKMVDACSFNDSFWVFVSGLTNQGYAVNILDTFTGQTRTYTNPLGSYPQTLGATDGVTGFDCTPGSNVRTEKPTPAQIRAILAATPPDSLQDRIVGEQFFVPAWISNASSQHTRALVTGAGVVNGRGPSLIAEFPHAEDSVLAKLRVSEPSTILPIGSERIFGDWYRVPVAHPNTVQETVGFLRTIPAVETVELNSLIDRAPTSGRPVETGLLPMAPPNDPYFPNQWHLSRVGADQAWTTSIGTGVKVAVVDCGVTHAGEDLDCHTFTDEINTITGVTGQGAADSLECGHGTHVAGTIAQCTGNGIGVAGVAPGATLMPIKVLPDEGPAATDNVAEGIVWAADHGAHVINMSLGSDCNGVPWPLCSNALLNDAVAYALARNIVVVASTGNSLQLSIGTPANIPGVMAVGATDIENFLAAYSNVGAGISLVAPGGELIPGSDINGDGLLDGVLQETWLQECGGPSGEMGYCLLQGTSMAAPHVAGAAAVLRSYRPNATALQVRQALEQSATDLGSTAGYDIFFGHGLLNIPAALARLDLILSGANTDPCVLDSDTACQLADRFEVEVDWTTVSASGAAQVMGFSGQRATSDQSSFWYFFDQANFEMGVKMVDACVDPFNAYWVFISGLTNQAFQVKIRDTHSGLTRTYGNPLGQYPQTIGATGTSDGFPCTP